jgi:hypothetical protein
MMRAYYSAVQWRSATSPGFRDFLVEQAFRGATKRTRSLLAGSEVRIWYERDFGAAAQLTTTTTKSEVVGALGDFAAQLHCRSRIDLLFVSGPNYFWRMSCASGVWTIEKLEESLCQA